MTTTMTVPEISITDVISYYHGDHNEDWRYECNKCSRFIKQSKNTGFTNLKSHLSACVGPDYFEHVLKLLMTPVMDRKRSFQGDDASGDSDEHVNVKSRLKNMLFQTFYSPSEVDVSKWIEWVVMRNQCLIEVEDPLTRQGMSYSPLSVLKHYGAICLPLFP
jgi:hypothetical protein